MQQQEHLGRLSCTKTEASILNILCVQNSSCPTIRNTMINYQKEGTTGDHTELKLQIFPSEAEVKKIKDLMSTHDSSSRLDNTHTYTCIHTE